MIPAGTIYWAFRQRIPEAHRIPLDRFKVEARFQMQSY